jgi:hypothetical protein
MLGKAMQCSAQLHIHIAMGQARRPTSHASQVSGGCVWCIQGSEGYADIGGASSGQVFPIAPMGPSAVIIPCCMHACMDGRADGRPRSAQCSAVQTVSAHRSP